MGWAEQPLAHLVDLPVAVQSGIPHFPLLVLLIVVVGGEAAHVHRTIKLLLIGQCFLRQEKRPVPQKSSGC